MQPRPQPAPAADAPDITAGLQHVAGTRLSIRRTGHGPPVVCLHAVGHDARDFDDLARRLGHAFEFISVDWPGHGESPADGQTPGSRHYGALLIDLLDRLELRDAIVLGNSVGGGAAIVAAAARPERIRALVLCDSAGLVGHSFLVRFACRWQARLFARGEAGDPGFPEAYRRYYEKVLSAPAAAARRAEIVAEGPRLAPLLHEAWIGFGEPDADLRALIPEVRCPVFIAWAKRDRSIPWMFSQAGARRFPDHRVEFFEGGHSAFLEAPAEFDAALQRFAEALPRSAGGEALAG